MCSSPFSQVRFEWAEDGADVVVIRSENGSWVRVKVAASGGQQCRDLCLHGFGVEI